MSFELILPFLRPIKSLLLDESVSEIMGNPDASWWYERDGIVCREETVHFDAGRLRTGLEVIANHLGKRLDEDNPLLHAQLPDGIRKFTSRRYTVDDLITRGTLTRSLADYLSEQITNGKTLLISGGTGTGKTTLLNILAQAIPEQERIIVIEDTAELRIEKPNVLAVECQTDTFKARISFDDLLKSALRWRPDRIILGEVRGIEARTLLIPSIPVMPDRWRQSMRIPLRRPSIGSPISSFEATRKRRSPTQKPRSGKRSTSLSTWNGSPGAGSSVKCWHFVDTTETPSTSSLSLYSRCNMARHRREIAVNVAAEFLSRSFSSGETIAILLRRSFPAATVQRIAPLERALQPRYLGWLAHENAAGASVYVAANPVIFGSRKRTKESIAEVRHLYLDLDTDGDSKLAALRSSNSVPTPTAIVSTSAGKYQVLWRVKGFSFEEQERVLKLLAITFGGDPACTDCNRVLRLPGYLNQKYDPAHLVGVEYAGDSTSYPRDFRLAMPTLKRELIRGGIRSGKPTGKHSNSEQDWTWILQELARGKDPIKLTRTLAERRSDKSNPLYYAQRTVDVASAWLWLMKGFPIADVVTMLQVRRCFEIPSNFCSARAHEIAFTAQRMIARKKIA